MNFDFIRKGCRMCSKLNNEQRKISLSDYTLKEIALYFERYDGYTCKIETESQYIKFEIDKACFPHLIGMQYAFSHRRDKNVYKGESGFNLVKNGKITIKDLQKAIKTNTKSQVTWRNVKNRIEYLPMFFNTIEKKSRLKILIQSDSCRNTKLKGQNILFKVVNESDTKVVYPSLILKNIKGKRIVIETFIVEQDITLLANLKEEKIRTIELTAPLDNTKPLSILINKKKENDNDVDKQSNNGATFATAGSSK